MTGKGTTQGTRSIPRNGEWGPVGRQLGDIKPEMLFVRIGRDFSFEFVSIEA